VESDPSDPAMMPSMGTVRFVSEKPYVEVTGDLILTSMGTIETVPGAEIHLTGSHVYNTSLDPAALAGLGDLHLSLAGDGSVLDTFEVAGDPTGDFDGNFAVGRITLGGATRLQLVDLFDNGNRGAAGHEALFLGGLFISPTATLDINGVGLFIRGDATGELKDWIPDGLIFDSAGLTPELLYDPILNRTVITPIEVPEPSAIILLAAGLVSLGSRRRRLKN